MSIPPIQAFIILAAATHSIPNEQSHTISPQKPPTEIRLEKPVPQHIKRAIYPKNSYLQPSKYNH